MTSLFSWAVASCAEQCLWKSLLVMRRRMPTTNSLVFRQSSESSSSSVYKCRSVKPQGRSRPWSISERLPTCTPETSSAKVSFASPSLSSSSMRFASCRVTSSCFRLCRLTSSSRILLPAWFVRSTMTPMMTFSTPQDAKMTKTTKTGTIQTCVSNSGQMIAGHSVSSVMLKSDSMERGMFPKSFSLLGWPPSALPMTTTQKMAKV
mmetsp:Transcript_1043/g.2810  ORF Transcript_1043/g.2810 Transcript_1043/m.2810 type:complete len:206 (+) Transcript_1043:968-1585(+)